VSWWRWCGGVLMVMLLRQYCRVTFCSLDASGMALKI
jgi:hypothetical protein